MSEKSFDLDDYSEFANFPALVAREFSTVSVGEELPPRVYSATRGDLVNYSGVVGDPNPIHFSDAVAQYVGFQTVVAHGMFSMGIGASYITNWLGDPRGILDYTVRFTNPWFVPPTEPGYAEFSGKIKSLDPETKTGAIVLVAKQDERKLFGKAIATVRFS